jgi:hypothetical protein
MNDIKDARSVYLNYEYPESILFHNEILVEKSCHATYFCVCGFHLGYFGIQHRNSDKIAIFSVWDSKDDNPSNTTKNKQAYAIESNSDAVIKRFGGEGSGIQCIYEYPWDIKKIYQFEVRSTNGEDVRINYSAFIKEESDKEWIHLATYSCLTEIPGIKGFYSFVEDFGRDGRTPNLHRSAQYINGFSVDRSSIKIDFRKAKFTAVDHPLNNINAELLNNGFRLVTGGNIIQKTPLNTILQY